MQRPEGQILHAEVPDIISSLCSGHSLQPALGLPWRGAQRGAPASLGAWGQWVRPAYDQDVFEPSYPSLTSPWALQGWKHNQTQQLILAAQPKGSHHWHPPLHTHFQIHCDLFMSLPNCILVLIHLWQVSTMKQSPQGKNIPG